MLASRRAALWPSGPGAALGLGLLLSLAAPGGEARSATAAGPAAYLARVSAAVPAARGLLGARGEPSAGAVTASLPARGAGALGLRDPSSGLSARVGLRGAPDAAREPLGPLSVYRGAGGERLDVIYRAAGGSVEDFVVLWQAPRASELRYDLSLGDEVAGLRLVGGVLELLDARGAPRLRAAPPYLVDSRGERREAALSVEGCAVDTLPAPPWGRPVLGPGARRCTLAVRWQGEGLAYPALLDPSWTSTKTTMASARSGHAAALLPDNTVLVAGGVSDAGLVLASAEIYSYAQDAWAVTGPMSLGRRVHTASALASGEVLVAGGLDKDGHSLPSAELYEPSSGAFVPLPFSMGAARAYHTATVLKKTGRVLVVGGLDRSAGGAAALDTAELYDPFDGKWSGTVSPMNSARSHHVAARLSDSDGDDRVLIAGGYSTLGAASLKDAEIFDPSQGALAFQLAGKMGAARSLAAAATLPGGRVVVAGGCPTSLTPSFDSCAQATLGTSEIFSLAGGAWAASNSDLSQARSGLTAVRLASGRVLAIGGQDQGSPLPSVDEFVDSSDLWSVFPSLKVRRRGPTVTVMPPSGTVLVAGGVSEGQAATDTAEVYPLLGLGAACAGGDVCGSGFCSDGVCCDAACDAPCATCLQAAKGAGVDGVCGPAAAGQNPRAACLDQPDGCGTKASCDAAGACDRYKGGEVCKAPVCANAEITSFACVPGMACVGTKQSCSPYAACADGASCASSCAGPSGCAPGVPCVGSKCVSNLPNGAICSANAECLNSHCSDGVCCDTACDAGIDGNSCLACTAADKADHSADGTCGAAASGLSRGACDTRCEHQNGQAINVQTTNACDGLGHCMPTGFTDCGGAVCDDASRACLTSCSLLGGSAPECVHGEAVCEPDPQNPPQLKCKRLVAQGQACATTSECRSQLSCAGGLCCNDQCLGACHSCRKQDGVAGSQDGICQPVMAGTGCNDVCQGDTSRVHSSCDAVGACNAESPISCAPSKCANGQCGMGACTSDPDCSVVDSFCKRSGTTGVCTPKLSAGLGCDRDAVCQSSHCVDKVCCSSVCRQCEACDTPQSPGTCVAIAGPPRAERKPCVGAGPCGGRCDGMTGESCVDPGPSVACSPFTCVGDQQVASFCDGMGTCANAATITSCSPYACGAAGCLGSCATDAQCAAGFFCDPAGQCATNPCSSPTTFVDARGTHTCSPGRLCNPASPMSCTGGCTSSADCQAGLVCHADGSCAPPLVAAPDAACGCALPGRGAGSGWAPLAAALGALLLGARRARARPFSR